MWPYQIYSFDNLGFKACRNHYAKPKVNIIRKIQ